MVPGYSLVRRVLWNRSFSVDKDSIPSNLWTIKQISVWSGYGIINTQDSNLLINVYVFLVNVKTDLHKKSKNVTHVDPFGLAAVLAEVDISFSEVSLLIRRPTGVFKAAEENSVESIRPVAVIKNTGVTIALTNTISGILSTDDGITILKLPYTYNFLSCKEK